MKRENSNYRSLGQPLKAWVQRMRWLLTFMVCVFTLMGVKELSYAQVEFIFPRDGVAGWREVHTSGVAGDWITGTQGLIGTIPNDQGWSFFFPPATLSRPILRISSTFQFIQSVDYNGAGVGIIGTDATNDRQTNLRCQLSERENHLVLDGWLNARDGSLAGSTGKGLGRDIKLNTPYTLTLEVEGTACRCILDGETVLETIIADLARFPSQMHPTLFIIEARAQFANLTTTGAAPTTTVPPPTGCVQPPSGLVSWWPGDGSANDIVNGNHGMLQNGATFAAGKVGQAFSFDGVDDHVRIPHNSNLNPTGPFSVDAWFKANPQQFSPDGLFAIIDKSHGFIDGTGWAMQGHPGGFDPSLGRTRVPGEMSFAFGKGGSGVGENFISVGTRVSVLDDQWHHITGVFTGSELRIYLDGELKESRAFNGLPVNNDRDVFIGRAFGGGTPTRHFRGLIDEVEFYNRSLTASEIQAIFNAGSAGKCKAVAPSPTTTNVVQFTFPRDGITGWREVHARGVPGDWRTDAQGLVGSIPNDVSVSFFFPPTTLPRQKLSVSSTFSFIQSVDYNGAGVGIIDSSAMNTTQTHLRCELSARQDHVVLRGGLNSFDDGPTVAGKSLGRDIVLNTPYKLTLEVEGTTCRCILDGETVVTATFPDLVSFPSQMHPTLFIIEANARFADLTGTPLGAAPTPAPTPTVSLIWRDFGQDKVGGGGDPNPNGQGDGHFSVVLNVQGTKTVSVMTLMTTDERGNPAFGPQVWNTAPDGHWILGVFRDGIRLNPTDTMLNDLVSGQVTYEIFGNDSGYFKRGQFFSITVKFTDNTEVKAVTSIPTTVATTTTTTTTIPVTTTTVPTTTTTIRPAAGPGINYSNTTFQVNDAEGFNVTMRNVEIISQNPLTGTLATQSFDVGLEIRLVAGAGPFGVALVLTDVKPASPGRPSSTKGTTLDFTNVIITSQGPEGTNIVLENLGVAIENPITRRREFKSFRVGLQLGPLFNAPPFNFGFVITSLE